MSASDERYVVTRTIAATPAEIFAVLVDPARHQDTEPTDWVRDPVDTAPITGAGQMFAMNMYLTRAGGDYVTHNLGQRVRREPCHRVDAGRARRRGRACARRVVLALRPRPQRPPHGRHPHLRLERHAAALPRTRW